MNIRRAGPDRVPKIIGADVELGNFVDGMSLPSGTGDLAARLLLRRIDGVPAYRTLTGAQSQLDRGRRFLASNGGCAYIDLDHLELALAETASATDFVAHWRAMVGVAQTALDEANQDMPDGHRLRAFANCSDGIGHSYGAHTNVLLTRRAYDNIFSRRSHYLAYLAAFQASSVVFTGAGKVGAENGRPHVDFQLSQRNDFIEVLCAERTTFRRPLVNSRDEPLCGTAEGTSCRPALARLHVIFFDATLAQVATWLRIGTLQIIVAMIEAESVDVTLTLADPLEALDRWSRDPDLREPAESVDGSSITALELQLRFIQAARRFAETHGFDDVVPDAEAILDLWEDTIRRLERRETAVLARRLDWVLKRQLLDSAMDSRAGLTWDSAQMKHLDQMYASIDPRDGLFLACEDAGHVDRPVSDEAIVRAMNEPPDDTRAWARAHLLRQAESRRVEAVDWDGLVLNLESRRSSYILTQRRAVQLAVPYHGRAHYEAAFRGSASLDDVLARLEAVAPSSLEAPSIGTTH